MNCESSGLTAYFPASAALLLDVVALEADEVALDAEAVALLADEVALDAAAVALSDAFSLKCKAENPVLPSVRVNWLSSGLLAILRASAALLVAVVLAVVAEAASTIKNHFALSVLVVRGCEPLEVWAVIAWKILFVLVSLTISRTL